MLYKKYVNETRRRELISAAIKVIAENGLENHAPFTEVYGELISLA